MDPLANDSDPEGGALTFLDWTPAAHGSVAADPGDPRSLIYTPWSLNYFGSDAFTYTVKDAGGATATATVQLTIVAVDDPPVASPDFITVAEDAFVDFKVTTNDYDPESGAVTCRASTPPPRTAARSSSPPSRLLSSSGTCRVPTSTAPTASSTP